MLRTYMRLKTDNRLFDTEQTISLKLYQLVRNVQVALKLIDSCPDGRQFWPKTPRTKMTNKDYRATLYRPFQF